MQLTEKIVALLTVTKSAVKQTGAFVLREYMKVCGGYVYAGNSYSLYRVPAGTEAEGCLPVDKIPVVTVGHSLIQIPVESGVFYPDVTAVWELKEKCTSSFVLSFQELDLLVKTARKCGAGKGFKTAMFSFQADAISPVYIEFEEEVGLEVAIMPCSK